MSLRSRHGKHSGKEEIRVDYVICSGEEEFRVVNVILGHPLGQDSDHEETLQHILDSATHSKSSIISYSPLREVFAIVGAPTEEDLKRQHDEEALLRQKAEEAERLRLEEETCRDLQHRSRHV